MNVQQLRRLRPRLRQFLGRFDDCFRRKDTRAHLTTYVTGQLSELPQKSVEPIALRAGTAPRTLQEFLSQHCWDHEGARDRLQQIVRDEHDGPNTIGIIDETSDVKKGDKTPGVQRQWCGAVGKVENCITTVHLGYAQDDFHCLLDGELYVPEAWAQDRQRCREAGIPEEMGYRPKWRIALELYDRAVANGLRFDWLTFDEGYGGKPELLRALSARSQCYVAEAPLNTVGWLEPPRVVNRPYRKHGRGRGRKTPRLAADQPPPRAVADWLEHAALARVPWQRWRVKDGDKGPMVWEAKEARFWPVGEDGLPGAPLRLVVARSVTAPREVKVFLSNAPPETRLQRLLLVAFSRWRVERCFEDQKSEIGLDQYEGRRYQGLKRHLILSCVSYLFLSRVRQEFGGEKSGANGLPSAPGGVGLDPVLVVEAACAARGVGADERGARADPASQRGVATQPHEADAPETPRAGDPAHRDPTLYLGTELAL